MGAGGFHCIGAHSWFGFVLDFHNSNIHLSNWGSEDGCIVVAGGREGGQAPILGGRRKRRRRRRRGTHLRSRRPSTRRPRPSCSPLPNIPAAPPIDAPDISSSGKTMSSLPRDVAFAWKRPVLVTALWRKCLFDSLSTPPSPSHCKQQLVMWVESLLVGEEPLYGRALGDMSPR